MTSRAYPRLALLAAAAALALALGLLRDPIASMLGWGSARDVAPTPAPTAPAAAGPREGLEALPSAEPLAPPPAPRPAEAESDPLAARDVLVRVFDAQGRPLGGAHVFATLSTARTETGTTDDAGEVHMALAPGDWSLSVYWTHSSDPLGRRFVEQRARIVSPDTSELTVSLGEAEEVAGVVQGDDGRPVSRVHVVAYRGDEPVGQNRSDVDGRFSIEVPKGSRVTLRIEARDESPDRFSTVPFTGEMAGVASGTTGVVLVGRPPPADRRLTVVVLDPERRPVAGACIGLYRRQRARTARTDAKGRAEFSDLSAELWRVFLSRGSTGSPEWIERSGATLVPDGQEVEFSVGPAAPVAGTVADAGGKPIPGLLVEAVAAEATGAVERTVTDEAGRFRLFLDPRTRTPIRLRAARDESDPADDRPVLLELHDIPATDLSLRLP